MARKSTSGGRRHSGLSVCLPVPRSCVLALVVTGTAAGLYVARARRAGFSAARGLASERALKTGSPLPASLVP